MIIKKNWLLILLVTLNQTTIAETKLNTSVAYFAGGCFWGVEYFFEKQSGVIDAVSGYMGGQLEYPTYYDVSYKNSGHVEVVAVEYDSKKVNYETLARLFFEIHDPTQTDGQGPDIGEQYLSIAFYNNQHERKVIEKLIAALTKNGYKVATKVKPAKAFWVAEKKHQDYYTNTNETPYCHTYVKRF